MKRNILLLIAAGICGFCSASACAADPAPAPGLVNPFDKDDPQMQKVKALHWQGVDFEKQDLKTRCVALLALNTVLTRIGGKTDARLDLLVDYFEQEKLGEIYAGQLADLPDQKPIPFEDTRKIAVAFLQSPLGMEKFGDDLEGCDENTLKAYERLYDKSAISAYAQTAASRIQVASMGVFLQKQGKFDEFVKWAKVERERRQAAYEKENEEKQKQYAEKVKNEKEKQAAAYAESQAKLRASEAAAASQMEAGIEYQEMSFAGAPSDNNEWSGDTYWPWTGAYYATGVYRGAVADKAANAYRNWNGGRVRAGGGGRRR